MPEIITIDIQVTTNREKLLKIPEIIEVPKNSIIRWNITGFEKFREQLERPYGSFIFTLYFDNKSPFSWQRQFIQIFDDYFIEDRTLVYRLAEDMAVEKGDYKYGVNVFDAKNNEPVYDEDPILRVF